MANKDKRDDAVNNPLQGLLGFHVRRASNAMVADLSKRLAPLDLTVTKASVLLLIEANPGITQIQISRTLAVKRANMAPLITALEKAELISKRRVDGRSHGLELTAGGRQVTDKVRRCIEHNEHKFADLLSEGVLKGMLVELPRIWGGKPG